MANRESRSLLRKGLVLLVAAVALCLVTSPSPAAGRAPHGEAEKPEPEPDASSLATPRGPTLPNDYNIRSYVLRLEPNYQEPLVNTSDFSGEVEIEFRVTRTTKNIVLFAGGGMTVHTAVVVKQPSDQLASTFSHPDGSDILTITTTADLTATTLGRANTYTVTITFTGEFQTNTLGFYKSTYKKGSETGVLFTTQFQPDNARKAFPCFDEPTWKSPFQLTIDVPEGYNALSNTPVKSRSPSPKTAFEDSSESTEEEPLTRIEFEQTVSMSTYLLAFVVYETSSFVSTHEVITDDKVSIISWGHKEAVDDKLLEYSQDVSFKILQDLEDYTGVPYKTGNMRKIDQVAVPDFSAGAMENWGLVIYRQSRLFFNETADSEATRKSVAAIIAHELTHQWFGNLVTTAWWDTTWLNEGFARYFQYLILSRLFPAWRMMDQLLLDQQMTIFVSDSVSNALPLTYPATSSQEINSRFGTITYSKGASVVRMISYLMGEDNFRNGLKEYLKRGFSTVTPTNLFTDLNKHLPDDRKPSVSLASAMDTWLTQAGFPVVHVERNYTTKTATFTQYRFYTDGTIEDEDNPTTYHIPITWSSKDDATPRFFWFSDDVTLTKVPEIDNWILVHANGYYRVNYDEGNWITLALTMVGKNQERVPPADRAKLVDDALALARLGSLKYRVLAYMLRYLVTEKDVLPWAAANRGLRHLDIPLGNVDTDGVIYGYLRQATAGVYKSLSGFSKRGDPPELILRAIVAEWACRSGHTGCLEEAEHLLERHLQGNAPLDPNLDDVIRCYGARAGSFSLWEKLWNVYAAEENDAMRETLLKNLACSEDFSTLRMLFTRVSRGLYGSRKTEVRKAFQAALAHPKGVAATLDYIIQFMPEMRSDLEQNDIENIIRDLTDKLTSEAQLKRIDDFLEQQLEDLLFEEDFVDSMTAKVRVNVEEVQEYAEDALKAFADAVSDDAHIFFQEIARQ